MRWTVLGAVVCGLIVCETVLPRAFAALRKWRRERAKAKRELKEKVEGAATVVGGGLRPPRENEVTLPDAPVAAVPCPTSSVQDEGGEGQGQGTMDVGRLEDRTEADRLWSEAREMPHNFTPDWERDQEYLSKIYAAAKLGHLEAMVKLGEYAYRRRAVVEAFYWTLLAELKGAKGLGVTLREMRSRWLAEGCPAEYSNAYTDFTEEQGVFARAVLRLQCGVDPQYARARLKELADRGVPEAQLFLSH